MMDAVVVRQPEKRHGRQLQKTEEIDFTRQRVAWQRADLLEPRGNLLLIERHDFVGVRESRFRLACFFRVELELAVDDRLDRKSVV